MVGDKTKTASLILSKLDGKGEESEVPSEESDAGEDGLDVAASDLIAAVAAKDTAGVKAALKAAYEMCRSEPDDEEGPATSAGFFGEE